MSKIKGKRYYRILFEAVSSLSVGSGENNLTDGDIMLDGKKRPYIPGTAMAGVYRSQLTPEEANAYLGPRMENAKDMEESRILVYDAVIQEGGEYLSKRDMVALDEYKTAKKGAKFDFQIVEPGITFITYIEQNLYEDRQEDIVSKILGIWQDQGLCFGAKTMRGYGKTVLKKAEYAEFLCIAGNKEWIEFDLYDEKDSNWKPYELKRSEKGQRGQVEISLELALAGGVSIREYSTGVNEEDYRQMTLKSEKGLPVIPGTSWAGAFRSKMRELGLERNTEEKVWGSIAAKSLLSFSESYIEGGTSLIYSRNAIDRFTNATIDGALYTEKTHYFGATNLNIAWKGDRLNAAETEKVSCFLAAAVMDLHMGYLAVGGLTAIGRGLFRVEGITVNGEQLGEISYDRILQAIRKYMQEAA